MIIVDSSTRQFSIPAAEQIFGVEADAGSEVKYFQAPRYVGNNLDLAGSFLRINYRNANGDKDSYLIQDVTVDGDKILFSWTLTPKVTDYKGEVKYVLCATGPDLKVAWHTTLGAGKVLEGLEPDNSHVEEETSDVVAQLIALVAAQATAVEDVGAEWIRNVQNEGTDQIRAVQAAEATAKAEIEAKGKNVRDSIPEDYAALSAAVALKAPAIVCEAEGAAITLNDSSDMRLQGMRIFGKSTQDGVPSPAAPVEIVSVENPTVSVNDQTLSIPRTLPGIPVTSGGNYIDATGQQWVCDEVDVEKGKYVQRIGSVVFDGSQPWNLYSTIGSTNLRFRNETIVSTAKGVAKSNSSAEMLCSALPVRAADATFLRNDGISLELNKGLSVYYDSYAGDVNAWTTYLSENPMTVQYVLAEPIETPLSETEIAAYRALHTNKPHTTIINDGGAHMAVEYVADTKLYIDNLMRRN